jgi:hypothetical protein
LLFGESRQRRGPGPSEKWMQSTNNRSRETALDPWSFPGPAKSRASVWQTERIVGPHRRASRVMRVSPCDEPRSCGGLKRSRPTAFTPRFAS